MSNMRKDDDVNVCSDQAAGSYWLKPNLVHMSQSALLRFTIIDDDDCEDDIKDADDDDGKDDIEDDDSKDDIDDDDDGDYEDDIDDDDGCEDDIKDDEDGKYDIIMTRFDLVHISLPDLLVQK